MHTNLMMINAATISPPQFSFLNATTTTAIHKSTVRVGPFCCLRSNGDANGFRGASSQIRMEGGDDAEIFQSSSSEPDSRQNEIWQLFKEAQRNILYLNTQRLAAVEEVKKANSENRRLIDRIEQLEAERQTSIGKDNESIYWDLLLRIDGMVLTGMVTTEEASDLRRLVMNCSVSVADILSDPMERPDTELLAELRSFSVRRKRGGFHIVHICTEMEPLVTVGSLAPYVTGISHALQRKGYFVEVILPKYSILSRDDIHGLREIGESYSYFNGQLQGNKIWTGVVSGVGVTLIEPMYYSSFFDRERIYGYSDDFERFAYFSRASLDYIVKSGKQPDIIHIHNWETAIVGPLFWDIFVKQGLESTRVLLTCQGFDSQCLEKPEKLALCGLDPARLHRLDRLQDNAKTHLVNILKGGVVYSNKVVILSSMYSKDRLIRSLSHGLEPILTIHREKLLVAPCGFDRIHWDPSKDNLLPDTYSAENLKGKAVCKIALQQKLGLSDRVSAIFVGIIITEVSDIDIDNLKSIIQNASGGGAQFIFAGINNKPGSGRNLKSLQEEFKDEDVRFISSLDDSLLHLVFAGSDIVLCQSFHDPVLQVPLKALKYGAVPIAITSNGSMPKHFVDHDSGTSKFSQFICSTFGNMHLNQALDEIRDNPSRWNRMIKDAMTKDFAWDAECCDIHVAAYRNIKEL